MERAAIGSGADATTIPLSEMDLEAKSMNGTVVSGPTRFRNNGKEGMSIEELRMNKALLEEISKRRQEMKVTAG